MKLHMSNKVTDPLKALIRNLHVTDLPKVPIRKKPPTKQEFVSLSA